MGRQRLTVRVSGLPNLPAAARKPARIAAAVRRAFELERPDARGEVAVVFVSRREMLDLNRQYLGHDYDTDVIAFEQAETPGIPPEEAPLGDIYISGWMAARSAAELGHSVLREAMTLAAHGSLHLLGHDDHAPRAKARMFKRQERILDDLKA